MMDEQIQFVLIFKLENFLFGIRIEETVKVIPAVEIKHAPASHDFIEGFIVVEGELVPVYNLRKKLQIKEPELNPAEYMILIKMHNSTGAVRVDEVIGTEYIFREPGTGLINSTDELLFYKNLTLMDENLLFVPDPGKFLRESEYINVIAEFNAIQNKTSG